MAGERDVGQKTEHNGDVEAIQAAAQDLVPGDGNDMGVIERRNRAALAILKHVRNGMEVTDAIMAVSEELVGPKEA